MEFGPALTPRFDGRWDRVLSHARIAGAAGSDVSRLTDHLLTPTDPSRPVFEAWTAVTGCLRPDHLVGCVPFRNVGLLTPVAVTIDHASGRRCRPDIGTALGDVAASCR